MLEKPYKPSFQFRFNLRTLFCAILFLGLAISSLVYPNPPPPSILWTRILVLCPSIGAAIGVFLGKTFQCAVLGLIVAYAAILALEVIPAARYW